MTTPPDPLDAMRARALREADRAGRTVTIIILAAALVEAGGLLGLLLLVNFRDPLHRLLLVHALLIYGTLGIGLVAVAAYVRQSTLRILQALEAMRGPPGP